VPKHLKREKEKNRQRMEAQTILKQIKCLPKATGQPALKWA
jgi:hypothetical protein